MANVTMDQWQYKGYQDGFLFLIRRSDFVSHGARLYYNHGYNKGTAARDREIQAGHPRHMGKLVQRELFDAS